TEAHGPAKVATAVEDRDLLGHCRNDRMRSIRRELAAVGSVEPGHVPRNLDHHALQAKAESQDGDLVLPGVTDCAPLSVRAAPSPVWQSSEPTQRITTFAWLAKPPARSASQTERYASGRSTYLPTSAIVTSSFGWGTRASRAVQRVQSTSRNRRSSRRTT